MFDVNLLSTPGISENNEENILSFLKADKERPVPSTSSQKTKKIDEPKGKKVPIVSFFTIAFITIVSVLFYPVLSTVNLSTAMVQDEITTEEIIDNVLKIILQSKKDSKIEALQFLENNILVRLSASNQNALIDIPKELKKFPQIAIRIFGNQNEYTMMAKFPWARKNTELTIINSEQFFNLIKPGKNVQQSITQNEIALRGNTSDIISIFLQMANAKMLTSNEMLIQSLDGDSLVFIIKMPELG
jgi:hypothetical protein